MKRIWDKVIDEWVYEEVEERGDDNHNNECVCNYQAPKTVYGQTCSAKEHVNCCAKAN